MLRHKTRPKSSSDLGKIKQHVGFISVTVMLYGLQSGLLYEELDGPHWSQSSGPKETSVLPDKSWKEKGRKSSQQHEGRCCSALDLIAPDMWAGSR